MGSSSIGWVWSKSDHILASNKLLQSLLESPERTKQVYQDHLFREVFKVRLFGQLLPHSRVRLPHSHLENELNCGKNPLQALEKWKKVEQANGFNQVFWNVASKWVGHMINVALPANFSTQHFSQVWLMNSTQFLLR